jgi:hypothetical protein
MGMVVHQNVASFNRMLTTFAQEVGYTIEYASLREAALMCRDAIIFTPPFKMGGGGGETKQAELVGRRAVERDINSLFVAKNDKARVAGAMLLNNLASAAKRRNFGEFSQAMQAATDKAIQFDAIIPNKIVADTDTMRAYRKAQNFFNQSSGQPANAVVNDLRQVHNRFKRLTRQGKTKIDKGRGDYMGKFLVETQSELKAYIKERQAEVGRLKSGWWNVMQVIPKPKKKGVDQTFGRKGVAGYVKKFPGNNFQRLYSTQKAVNYSFGNLIGNADDKATKNNVENLIYSAAVLRMNRDLEQLLKRDTSNFNSGRIG